MRNVDLKTANKLIYEKSPYLLQHAYNPVQWYPWGEEAFRKARNQNKPIFLSIGYATCHWCHVMEKESFEDSEVAKLMNSTFINIKVDREERPDIDHIYMTTCQMMTGQGGWPLTIIMTPDQKPFFAATYIPKNNRYGRVGMLELIPRIQKVWSEQQQEALKSADKVVEALQEVTELKNTNSSLTEEMIHLAYQEFLSSFDSLNGGFGRAPKFPSSHNLMFLTAYFIKYQEQEALHMATQTIENIMKGGIFDHLEYGIHRYSVDEFWHVPHFEKMLYDQSMLLLALCDTYSCSKEPFFKNSAEKIIEYLLNRMMSSGNLFYSGEDADSEGEEGKFYVWSYEELKHLLEDEELSFLENHFSVKESGNWSDQGHPMPTNILHLTAPLSTQDQGIWKKLRETLLEHRSKRVRPLLDDKILADWNALTIGALARAGRTFQNTQYTLQAKKSLDALLTTFYKDDRLFHRYREQHLAFDASADDYSFLIFSLIEVFLATSEFKYLETAKRLQDKMVDEFWDQTHFGFFYTSINAEKLIARKKEVYDGAIPSSNSFAAYNLFRLGEILGSTHYLDLSNKIFDSFANQINSYPSAHSFFLYAYLNTLSEHQLVVANISQKHDQSSQVAKKIGELRSHNFPFLAVIEINNDSQNFNTAAWSSLKPTKDKAQFYICKNNVCQQPTDHLPDV